MQSLVFKCQIEIYRHLLRLGSSASVAAIVKDKLRRQAATLADYKQKVLQLQRRLIEVKHGTHIRQRI